MKILINPGPSLNIIVTIAMGSTYYDDWYGFAFPLWKRYCERHSLGLVVLDQELLSKNDPYWKKPTWQKFLIGDTIRNSMPDVKNVCYLDSDILINPEAPNVFDGYDDKTIALVSIFKNIPYPVDGVKRRMAYLRHHHYSKDYPLDSALFMTSEQLYGFHHMPVQEDFACAGFFVMNIQNHADQMQKMFRKYKSGIDSLTGGGDQTHFNYEIQSQMSVSWLDYKFQAIWTYEMAWKYPFLYHYGRHDISLIKECIESSLFTNYFLHFAGSWYESDMWKMNGILSDLNTIKQFSGFTKYLKQPVLGVARGQVKPSNEQLLEVEAGDQSDD